MNLKVIRKLLLVIPWVAGNFVNATVPGMGNHSVDICIYGATPAGITAALAAAKEHKKVLIIEPTGWPGGILSAGLKPIQDCPNFDAVGGITRQLILSLGVENKDTISTEAGIRKALRTMSPASIRADFVKLLESYHIDVIYEHRVSSVKKKNLRITQAGFDWAKPSMSGLPPARPDKKNSIVVNAKVFIDASYEGDLMALSGVRYKTGRESSAQFNETLAGVRPPAIIVPIDPYKIPGDKSSGLLPWVAKDHGLAVGSADHYTQAYNYRFYITNEPEFRYPFGRPENYNSADYEIVGRYIEYLKSAKAADSLSFYLKAIFPGILNARDYNYQRNSLITIAPLGISDQYASGNYESKAKVWKVHQDYLSGLHYFLSTDPRVPQSFREHTAAFGLDKRHSPEGWPHQLYIRVTRRMDGAYILTQDDVYNKRKVEDPAGLAQYGIDTYPARRYAMEQNGKTYVAVEGNMFIGGAGGPTKIPFQVPYRAIVPRRSECTNLIVPVCLSATHVAYASVRMEPVFMILGESAGIAAVQALNSNRDVQRIDQGAYQKKLKSVGQKVSGPL